MSNTIGDKERLILITILRIGANAYGSSIRTELNMHLDPHEISIGSVYVALERLEKKGFVKSALSAPQNKPGGRSKKLYKVTGKGQTQLQLYHSTYQRLTDGLVLA